ncbi:MAG: 2-hydroxyacyl-CoA dehydratase [Deltaproteobacteria bacterium]|nr:2-hydroxyacyl-CoA dehydratase [Deltaproteobacteria bacterium]
MFDDVMDRLRSSYTRSVETNPAVARSKNQGKPVVGVFGYMTPLEIIEAAGVFPVRLLGAPIDISDANQFQTNFMCHFGRSVLELGLRGNYAALDGLVGEYACEGGGNLAQTLLEVTRPRYEFFLSLPHNAGESALEFYVAELEAFRKSLGASFGGAVDDASLRGAVRVANEQRGLLRELYDLRGLGEGVAITGAEMANVIEYTQSVPKVEANALLRELISGARGRPTKPFSGPRLLLLGTRLHDSDLYEAIEEFGGMVVGDGLQTASQAFWHDVDESLPPLEALARHTLFGVPCSFMCSERVAERRLDHLLMLHKRYHAGGVVVVVEKWCDSMQMDRPFMIDRLRTLGIPVLSIEVERSSGASQIRNRLEALTEMMQQA